MVNIVQPQTNNNSSCMIRKLLILGFGILWLSAAKAQVMPADKILGDWISPEKDLIVRCFKDKNIYYSKVVWFKRYYDDAPDDPNGIPENQWLSAVVMSGFKYEDNEWNDGEIKNLKNGKKYSAYLKLNCENELSVVGYVFFRFFSETIVFRKFTEAKLPDFN